MDFINAIRNDQQSRIRTVLAVAVLAWLNVVLQPCVMAMPQPVETFGGYESHISMAEHHATNIEDQAEICPHCGANGSCSHTGFAKCDDIDAAKPNVPSKHADGAGEAPVAISSTLVDQVLARTHTASIIKTGKEFLPPPVPIRVLNCVYLK